MATGKDTVAVVVPTLNEVEAIGMVLDKVRAAGNGNVLVIDGYSVDGTAKVAGCGSLLAFLFGFRHTHNS